MGRALIGAIWLLLLLLLAVFGLTYFLYSDLKAPTESRWIAGTRAEYLADVVYGRFRSSFPIAPDTELAYVPKVGANRVRSPEYDVVMTYTEDGVRRQPSAETEGTELVVIVGDSHAAGMGVADDQTYSALLQTRHRHATVNTGVIGYSTARELRRLRRLGLLAKGSVLSCNFVTTTLGKTSGSSRSLSFPSGIRTPGRTGPSGDDRSTSISPTSTSCALPPSNCGC